MAVKDRTGVKNALIQQDVHKIVNVVRKNPSVFSERPGRTSDLRNTILERETALVIGRLWLQQGASVIGNEGNMN